jgi:hypothetical protein
MICQTAIEDAPDEEEQQLQQLISYKELSKA